MKKTVTKILALCMCLCMTVGMFAACGSKKEDAIIIGLSGPITGEAAVYGNAVKNSAEMAVDEINKAGGLDGVPFKLIAMDDKHDPANVAANYASMVDKGVQVALGCVTTNPGLEFAQLSAEDNMFFITPSASANDIVKKGDNSYQMCFADGNQGSVAAKYVNSLGLSKIGIFYKSDDNYSKGIYDQFKANLDSAITTVEASFTGDDKDFTTQINVLKDCDFIFMPVYYTPASNFMTQAKGKIADNATYYGCDGFDGIDSADGFEINTIPQKISMLSHFDSTATEGKAAEFIKKYTEAYGTDTLNQFGASAYDCIYALYNAMKEAVADGKKIDADTEMSELCDILTDKFNNGFTFSGVTGNDITWESTGYVKKEAIAYVIKEAN